MRTLISEIAEKNMMGYVHPTYLNRFSSQLIEQCAKNLEAHGYDDAAKQLRTLKTDDTDI